MKKQSLVPSVRFLLIAVGMFLACSSGSFGQQFKEMWKKLQQSEVMRQQQKNSVKHVARALWRGNSSVIAQGLSTDPQMREALGITEEQATNLSPFGGMSEMMNDPVFKEHIQKMQKLQKPDDPFLEKATPELQKEFLDAQDKFMSHVFQKMTEKIDNTLTPEQKRKMQEFQIASMKDQPVVSPNMFEALDLSDQQRGELDRIRSELEPDFEKNMDEMMDFQFEKMGKLVDYLDEGTSFNPSQKPEEMQKQMQDFQKKILDAQKKFYAEHPEYKAKEDSLNEKGKAFANRLKFKMFDVLTDEQMEKMGRLIDNPPDFAKTLLKRMKQMQGGEEQSAAYQPGIDSWKPGDAIPEEYKQKRKEGRFPKK